MNNWIDLEEYWYAPILTNSGCYYNISHTPETKPLFESKPIFRSSFDKPLFERETKIGFK